MAVDHIRYDMLAQEALRGVMRTVLADAAKNGLPGDHHFYITFDTRAEGVQLSARMREQYPEEMTIVLQHQFWDLSVVDDSFEVGLSFGGVPERLAVPFSAITAFYDPSVQFGFQFETVDAEAEPASEEEPAAKSEPKSEPKADARPEKKGTVGAPASGKPAVPVSPAPLASVAAEPSPPEPGASGGGAEVVRLDRFRKK